MRFGNSKTPWWTLSKLKTLGYVAGFIVLAGLIIWAGIAIATHVQPWDRATDSSQSIIVADWVGTYFFPLLGMNETNDISYGTLVLHLAIFILLFIAFAEIIAMFSTFSIPASYLMALGFSIISGVTGVIQLIVGTLGVTAGIGTIGIAIIVLSAFVAAVTLNMGIGGQVRRWRFARQAEIEAMRSDMGIEETIKGIQGIKQVSREFRKGVSKNPTKTMEGF